MTKWSWSGMSVEETVELVHERPYAPSMVGAMVIEDYANKGIGGFCWFESAEELVDYLTTVEPLIYDDEIAAERKPRFAAAAGGAPPLTEEARERVNEAARGLFIVAWWGRGEELASSDHPFAVGLREEFRDEDGDEGGKLPISSDEAEEWVEFVTTYLSD